MSSQHAFKKGDTCIFTNDSITGYKDNDGRRVLITRLKEEREWGNDRGIPEYVIDFLDFDRSFGCRENELRQIQDQ